MHRTHARDTRLCLWSLLALFAVSSPAWAAASVPSSPPSSWIHDGAGLLSSAQLSELTARKEQLERQTGARLVVLTLANADGEAPKSIAVRTLNMWNAGRKSALLLVLMSPRELYIQPGTDLAPVFDSATASSICSSVVAPKMRSGDRGAALNAGLEAIASRIVSASDAPSASVTTPSSSQSSMPRAPLRQYGLALVAVSRVGGGSWGGLGWVGGLLGLGGAGWGLMRVFATKCDKCGKPMSKTTETVTSPTTSSTGEGLRTYDCGSCGYSFSETFVIGMIVESTTDTSSSWSSSSSDSSWSSSSSDSSSSSSSSDSSGGGGSGW